MTEKIKKYRLNTLQIEELKRISALKWKRRLRLFLIIFTIFVFLLVGLYYFLQSATFENWFREKVIQSLSELTGREVTLDKVDIELPEFAITLNNLQIAGSEGEQESFFKVEKIHSRLKIFSLFKRKIEFLYVELIKPEIHIKVDENGKLNIPALKSSGEDGFFDTIVSSLNLTDGLFFFNDRVAAANGKIENFETGLRYDPKNESYEGRITFTNGLGKIANYGSFRVSLDSSFIFLPDRLIFPRLKLKFSGADITSSGVVYDFSNIKYNFDYSGTCDLKFISELLRIPVALEGKARLEGVVKSSDEAFKAEGLLKIKDTNIGPLNMRNLTSHYLLMPSGVQFSDASVDAFNGRINGSFVLKRSSGVTSYLMSITGNEVQSREILSELGFGEIGIRSRSDITVNLGWDTSGPESLNGNLKINMKKQSEVEESFKKYLKNANLTSGYRPTWKDLSLNTPISIYGNITVELKNGNWKLQTGDIQMPYTRFVIFGKGYLLDKVDEEIKIESNEIKELDLLLVRLIRALDGYKPGDKVYPHGKLRPPYVGLSGSGQFRGKLEYDRRTGLTIYGNCFGKRIWARNVYWDEGGGFVTFTGNLLEFKKGWTKKGEASSRFNGEIYLFDNPPEGADSLNLDVEITNFPCEDIQDLFYYERNIFGSVSGGLKLNISSDGDAQGDLDLLIENGRLYKNEFDMATIRLKIDNDWLRFQRLKLVKEDQEINTAVDLNLNDYRFNLKGHIKNVKLEELKSLNLDRSPLRGVANLELIGEGLPYSSTVDISGSIDGFYFLGKDLGQMDLQLTGKEGNFRFEAVIPDDSTYINMNMTLLSDYHFEAETEIFEVNLFKLIPYTDGVIDRIFGGYLSGRFKMNGSWQDPGDVLIDGEVTDLSVSLNNYFLNSDGSFKFTIHDFIINLPKINLTDGNSHYEIAGKVGLSRRVPSNLQVKMNIHLEELVNLFSDIALKGNATGTGYLRGFILDPYWGGELKLDNGYLMLMDLPVPFEDLQGDIKFTQNNLTVKTIKGKVGMGDIDLDGQLTFKNSKPDQLLFRAGCKQVQINYPAGVEARFSAALNLTGEWNNKELSGFLSLSKLKLSRRVDLEEQIGSLEKSSVSTYSGDSGADFLKGLKFNIGMIADNNIIIDNNLAQAELAADVRLTETYENPVFLGRIEVLHGQIYYRDRTFQVLNGSVDNVDPHKINPVIDFRARTKVKNYVIYITIRGTKDHLYPSLSSEPSLPTIDIINLLALGKPRSTIYQRSEETLVGVGLSSFLSKQIVGGIEESAERLFGFDRFRIDPFLVGAKANPTARLTVGKRITKDLTLVYSTNISQTQEDVLILEYRLSNKIILVASRDEFGAYGLDIQFESKF